MHAEQDVCSLFDSQTQDPYSSDERSVGVVGPDWVVVRCDFIIYFRVCFVTRGHGRAASFCEQLGANAIKLMNLLSFMAWHRGEPGWMDERIHQYIAGLIL
jgi:hypothetical protein